MLLCCRRGAALAPAQWARAPYRPSVLRAGPLQPRQERPRLRIPALRAAAVVEGGHVLEPLRQRAGRLLGEPTPRAGQLLEQHFDLIQEAGHELLGEGRVEVVADALVCDLGAPGADVGEVSDSRFQRSPP